MSVVVVRFDPQNMGLVEDRYPEATSGRVDDDSGALLVLVDNVYIGDNHYTDTLELAGYPRDGYIRWYLEELPRYETVEQRESRENNGE